MRLSARPIRQNGANPSAGRRQAERLADVTGLGQRRPIRPRIGVAPELPGKDRRQEHMGRGFGEVAAAGVVAGEALERDRTANALEGVSVGRIVVDAGAESLHVPG